ncbi:MAG: ribosome biogenesis GTPase Der [Bacteroidales bacterium]|nr:ribosome biogenesis GTPase Der [Bacteroidales bacterium]
MANILAIVGRPNVGKSTLFNRLTGRRQAIVHETSGVTRDRHYGKSDWNGITFSVIDTGGYVEGSEDVFESEIKKQALLAMDEADVILFVVDTKEGLTAMDEDVANILRRTEKKVFLVANKADNAAMAENSAEFYSLGFDNVWALSSINGAGTGDLLDEVVKCFSKETTQLEEEVPKFAVLGRPNVGKSSFINALLGENRTIVTDVAGTTRDTIHTRYKNFGFDFYLIDTAGLRRKTKVHENVEFYSVLRSVRIIEDCDVGILMIDATRGLEAQDMNIFHLIEKNRKGVVILMNKWDLLEKETNTHKVIEKEILDKLAPFNDVPVLFTSVTEKQRIFKALEVANTVYKNRTRRVSTSQLNRDLLPIIEKTPPPAYKGKYVKIKYITQLPTPFPAFGVFCNAPKYVRDPYKRFLENKIRSLYDFKGVPIEVYFREK